RGGRGLDPRHPAERPPRRRHPRGPRPPWRTGPGHVGNARVHRDLRLRGPRRRAHRRPRPAARHRGISRRPLQRGHGATAPRLDHPERGAGMTPSDTTTRRWTWPPTQRRFMVTALVVTPCLARGRVVALQDPTGHVAAAGEDVELTDAVHSGPTHEVRLPSSTVSIRVGAPTDEVDEDAVD